MRYAAPHSQGAYLYESSPRLPNQITIVIEYSIGEPFNKSGNGIWLCLMCFAEAIGAIIISMFKLF